jgi:hypothetical protein
MKKNRNREQLREIARKQASATAPEKQPEKKNAFNNAKKDSFNSTFIYKITFDNQKTIIGYSANSGFSEKNDKNAVLINYVLRMYKRGYLDYDNPPKDRIIKIEIFLNLRSGEKIIFRLFYDYFEGFEGFEDFGVFVKFLDSFYSDVQKRLPVQEIFNKYYRSDKSPTIEPFDYKYKRFITRKSLLNYCSQMYNKKIFTREQAMHFESKYLEVHNLKF